VWSYLSALPQAASIASAAAPGTRHSGHLSFGPPLRPPETTAASRHLLCHPSPAAWKPPPTFNKFPDIAQSGLSSLAQHHTRRGSTTTDPTLPRPRTQQRPLRLHRPQRRLPRPPASILARPIGYLPPPSRWHRQHAPPSVPAPDDSRVRLFDPSLPRPSSPSSPTPGSASPTLPYVYMTIQSAADVFRIA
jgi:hypothetical protein